MASMFFPQVSLQEQMSKLEQRLDMVILGLGELGGGKEERVLEPQNGNVSSNDRSLFYSYIY